VDQIPLHLLQSVVGQEKVRKSVQFRKAKQSLRQDSTLVPNQRQPPVRFKPGWGLAAVLHQPWPRLTPTPQTAQQPYITLYMHATRPMASTTYTRRLGPFLTFSQRACQASLSHGKIPHHCFFSLIPTSILNSPFSILNYSDPVFRKITVGSACTYASHSSDLACWPWIAAWKAL
jgi:hypothetical protein